MRFDGVIEDLAGTKGVLACAVVDYESGMILGGKSPSGIDLDVLAVSNTEIVRSEVKAIARMEAGSATPDSIEDILITMGKIYLLLRPMVSSKGLFLFLVLDKQKANLSLSRHALKEADRNYQDE
ncbi:hypothetical protein [Stenoxybacter acetivorans]|uniref:hypothetical protein n=1 Tax=Stenoxybacter acetivorans TaxID=422441 RepID=UPI00055EEDAD|nr:hypothetical protein [Stenoxybacter acetivorans]